MCDIHAKKEFVPTIRVVKGMRLQFYNDFLYYETLSAEHQKNKAVLCERLAEQEQTRASLLARLETLRSSVDVADDEAAMAVRRERDEAWKGHQGKLLAKKADIFEVALARDHDVAATSGPCARTR
ncbi:hypothetical protein [Mesorhizobium shangrilense]|uniref:Uncharacterized protein n=1 Tax=Mesorhizobium shangrilense TaxID=460060 RepID=A0ABV2DMH0_9HYPH